MKLANFIAKLFGNRNERQNSPDPETSAGAVNISAPIVRQKTELTNPIISGDEPMPSPQIQTLGGTIPDVPDNIASLPASQLPLGLSDPQNIAPTVAPRPVTEAEPLAEVTPRFGSPQLQKIEDEIQRREDKDFSIKKDENGNVIHRGKDRDKDHDAMDILKGLGIGALKGYLSTGNVGGAVGGAIGGGISSAVDRNYDEKFANNWKLNQERQKYAQQFQRERQKSDWLFNEEARKRKAESELLDNQGKTIKNQTDILDYMQKTNKSLYDSIMADNLVTPDEADKATKAGFPMQPYDARKFKTENVGGATFSTPELGAPQFKPVTSLPIDQEKVFKEVTTPSGNKYKLTQGKAAELDIAIAQGDANRAMQVILKNTEIENDNIEQDNKYRTDREKALAERDGAMAVFQASSEKVSEYETNIADLQKRLDATPMTVEVENADLTKSQKPNPEYQAIERSLDDARREYGNALKTKTDAQKIMTEKESLYNRLPAPKNKQTIKNAPRLSRITPVDEKTFRSRSQARGISGENLERAVKKAKEDGVIK